MTAITPIRPVPHGKVEAARPTHVRIRMVSWFNSTTLGQDYAVKRWVGSMPMIVTDRGDVEILLEWEWEPANPPAPVAADTAKSHKSHGSLDFDAKPQPNISQSEFRNLLCVLHGLDGVDLLNLPDDTARAFIANPLRQFLRADNETAAVIWGAMMLRVQP